MSVKFLMVVQDKRSNTGRIGERLRRRGYELEILCPANGAELPKRMNGYAGAVVFGGPMSANDDATLPAIRSELDWIPSVLDSGKPFLGICLGAQLLARALGAEVAPHPEGMTEIGYYHLQPTELGRDLFQDSLWTYHWHKEGFDLPRDATLLATGERFPNQAFRYTDAVYGIQFHPEVTLAMMHEWLGEAAASLSLPGAQSKEAHLQGHALHDSRLDEWVESFLDIWLAPPVAEPAVPRRRA